MGPSGPWEVTSNNRLVSPTPIGSMYAIYGNIYHQYTPNVSIYTSTMDPMGMDWYSNMKKPETHGILASGYDEQSLPWKDPPCIFKNGKASKFRLGPSKNHGYVTNNQRVTIINHHQSSFYNHY